MSQPVRPKLSSRADIPRNVVAAALQMLVGIAGAKRKAEGDAPTEGRVIWTEDGREQVLQRFEEIGVVDLHFSATAPR